MERPRRIVLILGNGFDLDLGLKTSYKNFWESKFCPKDYPAPLIYHLNESWPNSLESVRWYDLENELYYYAKNILSDNTRRDVITKWERDFIEIVKPEIISFGTYFKYNDLINSLLQKGILIEDQSNHVYCIPYQKDLLKSSVERDAIALDLIKTSLCKYLNSIENPSNKNNSISFHVLLSVLNDARAGDLVEIYTFNYTPVRIHGHKVDEVEVNYMHGNCDVGKVIIGTRDDSSIEKDYSFVQKAFDTSFYPPHLVKSLHDADDVIIFGHSIGENDRQYFKAFFKQQTNSSYINEKNITIFTRDHLSEIQIKIALQNMTDSNLSTLFGQNNIQIIKTKELNEDKENQKRFYDFLVQNNTTNRDAIMIIDKLLQCNGAG